MRTQQIRLACVALGAGVPVPGRPSQPPVLDAVGRLDGLDGPVDGVVLAGGDARAVQAALEWVRRSPRFCILPLFVTQPAIPPAVRALADGVVAEWSQAVDKASQICNLVDTLPAPDGDARFSQDERLLRFLFARPEAVLLPIQNPEAPRLYSYPLLEVLADAPDQVHPWVQSLLRRKLLGENRMVDRIRLCPSCQTAHLRYVDQCPGCAGADIHEQLFLHCLLCGHVGPQDTFTHPGGMACPQCKAALHHLGSDYDRARENYQCRGCGFLFVEPTIFAQCLHCGKHCSTDHLDVANVYELGFTERGRLSIHGGRLQDMFAVLDEMNYVSTEYFSYTLGWLLRQVERYPSALFTLLLVSLENVGLTAERIGRSKTTLMLEAFAVRLRSIVRVTDLLMRQSEHSVVLLLPQTTRKGAEILASRILHLQEETRQADGVSLQVRLALYSFPDDRLANDTAEQVLARLGTRWMETQPAGA